jgi:spermidine synthase
MRIALFAALCGALVWQAPFRVQYSKKYDERELPMLFERWTPTARLAVFDGIFWRGDPQQAFTWGMGTRLPKVEIPQLWLEQDGSAGTPITRFSGDFDALSFLLYDVTSLGYQVASPRRVAIIGAGGGRDILSALIAGADDVDAVEINGGVVEALSAPFRDFSGDVYHLENVTPVVSEGRSFLQGSPGDYDMIQIALTDSWAATAAGAFALSENNLYTVESYQLYWNRLSRDGIVSTSRYIRGPFGIEIPRLVVLIKEVLRGVGVADPNAHLVIATGGKVGTVLMSRKSLSAEMQTRVQRIARERGFTLLHPRATEAREADLLSRILRDGRSAIENLGVDLSPPTDDRPFFFHVIPVFSFTDAPQTLGVNGRAIRALHALMIAMFLLAVLLFFLPFLLAGRLPRGAGFWRGSAYFACIGLGFMLVELPWLQRFILPLGHPSHATTAVLASLLLGAGLGSLFSSKIGVRGLRRFGLAAPLLVGVVNLTLPDLFELTLGWNYSSKVAVAVPLVALVGVPLGMFFPTGMLRFGDDNKAWYWAINGACGVFSCTLSLALAMEFGLTMVTWVGVVAYAAACVLIGGDQGEAIAPK